MFKESSIIFLIPGFPADERDSTCLPAHQSFINVFSRLYPDVNIYVVSFQYPYQRRTYTWHGQKVFAIGGRNRGGIARRITWHRAKQVCTKVIREEKVSGILSFWYGECARVGELLGKKYRLPHYCWIMGQEARPGNNYIGKSQWLKSSVTKSNQSNRKKADSTREHGEYPGIPGQPGGSIPGNRLIALSDFLASEMEKNYGIRPAHIIPFGIDTGDPKFLAHTGKDDFANTSASASSPARDIDILGAGSLIALKRFDTFINVVSRLKAVMPGFQAEICGSGPEGGRLKEIIREKGMEETIRLSGEVDHATLMEKMRRTKILLHPSSYEGLGMVCLEALAAGARVISFVRPMDREIEGWEVVKDEEEMEKKARSLLKDESNFGSVVVPFSMEETVLRMRRLLVRESVISVLGLVGVLVLNMVL